jgi:hypothetical protein
MAYVVIRHSYDKNFQEFKSLLDSQDLIAAEYYKDYSNEILFMELCSIFKKDKYLNDKPVLKTVKFLFSFKNSLKKRREKGGTGVFIRDTKNIFKNKNNFKYLSCL